MGRLETLARVKDVGIIPAIRTANQIDAVKTAEAILAGGISIIEVSLAPRNALDALDAVATAHSKSMLIGAGTVVDAEGVRQAALAGAQFIVTPGFSAETIAKAQEFGLAIFAGALSPTEVQIASASGAEAVKLFPCFASGGPRYLRALCGQYPSTNFIASGGVGLENCADYIRAGACAIGVGGEIVDFDSMAAGDYRVFTVRAKRLLQAVQQSRDFLKNASSSYPREGSE
jgi:2-dehydro-3-deoxyphosphogluconate aldolase / (4S)-4-hydroxy-2-oxoglutarate aldolase